MLEQLKRKLIGGIWVLKDGDNSFQYCTESECGLLTSFDPVSEKFSGFHRTFLGIVKLEDYGSITSIGKMMGYSKLSPKISKKKWFRNLELDFFHGFYLGVIFVISISSLYEFYSIGS